MTTDKRQEQNLRVRAYHEAGHAIAAHLLGFRIKEASIVAHDTYEGDFGVELPEEIADPANWRYGPLRELTEKYDVMLMAGYPASEMAEVEDRTLLEGTARSDHVILERDAADSFPNPEIDPWLLAMRHGQGDDKYRVLVESRWHHLQQAYIEWIKERARALVRFPPHRYAVEVVAATLLERQSLNGPEVHAIITTALGEFAEKAG